MRSGKGIGSCAASPTRRKAAPQERSAANRRGEGDAQRRLARWAGSEGECVAGLKTLVNFSSQTIFSCSIRIGHLEIVSFPWTLARSSRPCHAHANSIACFSKKKNQLHAGLTNATIFFRNSPEDDLKTVILLFIISIFQTIIKKTDKVLKD
jgi:hypothetical protein